MSNNQSTTINNPKKLANDYTYIPDETEENYSSGSGGEQIQQTDIPDNQPKSQWEKYIDELDEARLRKVVELAKQKKYVINGKTYERNKIKVRNFNLLERMRATFAAEQNPRKATEILIDVYAKCAEFYLGMSKEEYEDLDDWEEIKQILDACAYRSNRPLPN